MPRNMSFSLTTEQIRARTKTVTRRRGWTFLKPGDVLNACVKCQGLKRGEKIEKLCQIRVVHVWREPLYVISFGEVVAEGFPEMTPGEFISMFCEHMNIGKGEDVTRIEFEYL